MLAGFYSAATALDSARLNQELVARNLAHIDVPGYRRSFLSLQTFEAALQGASATGETANSQGISRLGTRVEDVHTDFQPGKMQHTGRPLDVALLGDGFFVVEGPDGPLYTRNGVFHRNAQGELVTTNGLRVQGTGGPITIPQDAPLSAVGISANGTVTADGVQVGQLEMVAFADNSRLVPVGTTTYQAPASLQQQPAETTVAQGSRELSNVFAVEELVRMIAGLRQYEAAQRALRSLDSAVQQTTNPQA